MSKYVFDHVHLLSPDPTKTAEFYQMMFGAILVSSRDLGNGRVVINLNLGGVTILISKTTDEKQFGLAHFGIRTDHLEEAVDELKAKKVKFTREITQISPQSKISFLQATENVSIELQEGNI
jgi:lactoylglutathione lyase